jgi:hypothetical protein
MVPPTGVIDDGILSGHLYITSDLLTDNVRSVVGEPSWLAGWSAGTRAVDWYRCRNLFLVVTRIFRLNTPVKAER